MPGILRIGETIRRPVATDRRLVQDLLIHLEGVGFDAAPRFLGIDAESREILGFLPGEVPRDLGHYTDAQLRAAATLLRRFHDATTGFAVLRERAADVVCHNDWAPTNAVFRDGTPVGMIDFDTAAPGSRLWDLGYSAFTWLDLGNPDYGGGEQIRRLGIFSEGYGLPGVTAGDIAVHAVVRQVALAVSGRQARKPAMADWADRAATWTILNVTETLLPTGYGLTGG